MLFTGRPFRSGCCSNHVCNASSELKRLLTAQPPPIKTTVLGGFALTNFPFSKSTRIREVPSGDESSTVTVSLESLPLTSVIRSPAQLTQKLRPEASVMRWNWKSSQGCQFT